MRLLPLSYFWICVPEMPMDAPRSIWLSPAAKRKALSFAPSSLSMRAAAEFRVNATIAPIDHTPVKGLRKNRWRAWSQRRTEAGVERSLYLSLAREVTSRAAMSTQRHGVWLVVAHAAMIAASAISGTGAKKPATGRGVTRQQRDGVQRGGTFLSQYDIARDSSPQSGLPPKLAGKLRNPCRGNCPT